MIYRSIAGELEFKKNFLTLPIFGYLNSKIKLECCISSDCWDEDSYNNLNYKNILFKISSSNGNSIEILFDSDQDCKNKFNLFACYNGSYKKYTYICSIDADKFFVVSIKKNSNGLFLSLNNPRRVFSRKINKINKLNFYYVSGPRFENIDMIDCNAEISIRKL